MTFSLRSGPLLCAGLALLCTSCSLPETVQPTATIASDQDAYFVIGIEPENAKVELDRGSMDGTSYSPSIVSFAAFVGFPNDGFIVGKVKPNDLLSFGMIYMAREKGSIWGTAYLSCRNARASVFSVPAGKVTYFGDVRFVTASSGGLSYRYGKRSLDEVRSYLKTHYPALADKVEEGSAGSASGRTFSMTVCN